MKTLFPRAFRLLSAPVLPPALGGALHRRRAQRLLPQVVQHPVLSQEFRVVVTSAGLAWLPVAAVLNRPPRVPSSSIISPRTISPTPSPPVAASPGSPDVCTAATPAPPQTIRAIANKASRALFAKSILCFVEVDFECTSVRAAGPSLYGKTSMKSVDPSSVLSESKSSLEGPLFDPLYPRSRFF